MKITINVEGMMCKNCVKHVEEAIKGTKLAKKYVVSLSDKNVVIKAKDGADVEVFKKAIEEEGYTVTGVEIAAD